MTAGNPRGPTDSDTTKELIFGPAANSSAIGFDDINPAKLTGVGLQIPADFSYERWEQVGLQLSGVLDSSSWWLGDWLVFGKCHYSDRYQRAIRGAGLSYQTLRNYAWVARRFKVCARRPGLSFQHHAEVASLPVEIREQWLTQAEQETWTTKQLRHNIRDGHANPTHMNKKASLMPRIEIPDDRLDCWRRAADQSGADLNDWMTTMLDQAAQEVLAEH